MNYNSKDEYKRSLYLNMKNSFCSDYLDNWNGDPSFMLSLARGLLVLQSLLEKRKAKVSISEIVLETGLSRPTVRRCLFTLDVLDYINIYRNEVSIGPRLASLASAYLASSPLIANSQPILDELRDKLGRTITLGIRERFEAVYIAESYFSTLLSLHIPIGTRFPLYCTSIGRIFLAAMTPNELEQFFDTVNLEPITEYTLTDRSSIIDSLGEARRKGYALVDQEVEIGLRSISVPIIGRSGEIVAGLSVGTHRELVGVRELRSIILTQMKDAAEKISELVP